MEKKPFIGSSACTSMAHCHMCRSKSKEAWRKGLEGAYSIPSVNFDCPMNKPWTEDVPPPLPIKSRGFGDTLAKLLVKVGIKKKASCGCSKRQAKLNKLIPYGKVANA